MNVHFSSASPEWLTPPHILDRVITVLGAIDLDPASNAHTPPNVPARWHFTTADNGLAQSWYARVYVNPPYGRGIGAWVQKLRDEYEAGHVSAAIALLPARTDTAWWALLAGFPVCFVRGRLRFSGHRNSAPFPSAVVYLGDDLAGFVRGFGDVGEIRPPAHRVASPAPAPSLPR